MGGQCLSARTSGPCRRGGQEPSDRWHFPRESANSHISQALALRQPECQPRGAGPLGGRLGSMTPEDVALLTSAQGQRAARTASPSTRRATTWPWSPGCAPRAWTPTWWPRSSPRYACGSARDPASAPTPTAALDARRPRAGDPHGRRRAPCRPVRRGRRPPGRRPVLRRRRRPARAGPRRARGRRRRPRPRDRRGRAAPTPTRSGSPPRSRCVRRRHGLRPGRPQGATRPSSTRPGERRAPDLRPRGVLARRSPSSPSSPRASPPPPPRSRPASRTRWSPPASRPSGSPTAAT